MEQKKRALIITDDPDSNQSYGIIANYIIESNQQYDWHVISNQYQYGKPIDRGTYWKWHSGLNQIERDQVVLPLVISKTKPEFVMTITDVDKLGYIHAVKDRNLPWINYFPIDNQDLRQLVLGKHNIELADIAVTMSKFAYEFCKNYKIRVDAMIYPYVDTKMFRPFTNPELKNQVLNFKQRYGFEDKKVLLYVGRPGWRKNLEVLLGAFRKLCDKRDDVVLYLHTDFNDPAREFNFNKMMYAMDIPRDRLNRPNPKDMNWSIGLPQKLLAMLYNVADVYVTTHGGEGFGLPIAEAMATKVPFVATNTTTTEEFGWNSNKEWVRGFGADVKNWHSDRGVKRALVDIDDFVKKVEILLDDDDLRKDMGKKVRDWVVKNCSVPVISRKWRKLFKRIDIGKAKIIE